MPFTYGQDPWMIEIEDLTTLFCPFLDNGNTSHLQIRKSPYFPIVKTLLESHRCKAVVTHMRKHPDTDVADVAASFQAAVVDVLVEKSRRAARDIGATGLCIGGGVAANSVLRERILDACIEDRLRAFLPSRAMCTDNAAMIAAAGARLLARGEQHGTALNAYSRAPLGAAPW